MRLQNRIALAISFLVQLGVVASFLPLFGSRSSLSSSSVAWVNAAAFVPHHHHHQQRQEQKNKLQQVNKILFRFAAAAENDDDEDVDEKLLEIARNLKLSRRLAGTSGEDGWTLEPTRPDLGMEVHKTIIHNVMRKDEGGGLGLVLTELVSSSASSSNNNQQHGLVLISDVMGNAAQSDPPIHVGDVITRVEVVVSKETVFQASTVGLNYDATVDAMGAAKQAAAAAAIMKDNSATTAVEFQLTLNRLVPRATIVVEVNEGKNDETKRFEILAGSRDNLRNLLTKNKVKIYSNDKTGETTVESFGRGMNCGGEGQCGTCLVHVEEEKKNGSSQSMINAKTTVEQNRISRNWSEQSRLACQTIVGTQNVGGTLRVNVHPVRRPPSSAS